MDNYEEKIAELERERESLTERCRINSKLREKLQGEYDAMVKRRLEAQKEINRILTAELERRGVEGVGVGASEAAGIPDDDSNLEWHR